VAENWNSVAVTEVKVGDRIRHPSGTELTVSRIEPTFLGRDGMVAFIEDSPDRWYKAPMAKDGTVDVLVAD